ncbi:hypothetical protein [Streptomyces sp. NPDC054765]
MLGLRFFAGLCFVVGLRSVVGLRFFTGLRFVICGPDLPDSGGSDPRASGGSRRVGTLPVDHLCVLRAERL